MDAIEKNYRNFPRNPNAVRHYVSDLLDRDRILEAAFFCHLLLEEDCAGVEANKLGYRLAIKKMDVSVKGFEEQLYSAGAKKEDIYTLQLEYYIAFEADMHAVNCADSILDIEIQSIEALQAVIFIIEKSGNYDLASKFITCHYQRVEHSSKLDKLLKKILVIQICKTIEYYVKKK